MAPLSFHLTLPPQKAQYLVLKIIPASEPIEVKQLVLTLYGPPGVGKTSTAFSAHAPLLLDCDKGVHRSAFRKDAVQPDTWDEIASLPPDQLRPYRTIILDTVGRGLDLLSVDIMRDPKKRRGESLSLSGYGDLKSRFQSYLNNMRALGLDVVLIAHSDEKQQGDDLIERLDIQGGSKQEIYKCSDAMARIGFVGGQRVLNFSPTETQFGKDPADLGQVPVPHLAHQPDFLGEIIESIKASLNDRSSKAQEVARQMTAWMGRVAAAEGPEGLTALIGEAWDANAKRALLAEATKRGLVFDKEAGAFAVPAPV